MNDKTKQLSSRNRLTYDVICILLSRNMWNQRMKIYTFLADKKKNHEISRPMIIRSPHNSTRLSIEKCKS